MTSAAAADVPAVPPRWRRPIVLPRSIMPGDVGALALLAALVAVLCWPVIAQGRVYWERDVHLYLYPRVESFVRVIAAGSLPVWNPYVAFGEPMLANPQMQILYPPTWLNLVMKPWTWYSAYVVMHLFFSAAGAYVLARRFGTSRLAALLAAGAWTASGPLLSLVNNAHHLAGAAWIPWVVASSDSALATRRARVVLGAGIALALQIVAGSADMCALALLLAAANALRHVDLSSVRAPRNRGLLLAGSLVLVFGLGLSAAQWIPTLELARRSSRLDQPARMRTYWSAHPATLAQTILPAPLHELPLSDSWRAALFESREPFLSSLYLGLAAAVLVIVSVMEIPVARAIALLLLLIALVALGAHTPVFTVVTTLIPPLRVLRYPVKAMVALALPWALLAGLGADALAAAGRRRPRTVALTLAAAVLVASAGVAIACAARPDAIGHAFLQRVPLDPPFSAALLPVARRILIAVGLAAGVTILATLAPARRWALPVLTLLVGADLVLAGIGLNRTCAPELMAWRPPAVDVVRPADLGRTYSYDYYVATRARASLSHPAYALAATPGDPVVGALALRGALYPSVLGQWGVESSYDLDQQGLFPRELAILSRVLRLSEGTPEHLRLLRMGAVARVVAMHTAGLEDLTPVATLPTLFQEPLRVYAVPAAVARAHVVGGVVAAEGDAALLAVQQDAFDPARQVVLAGREDVPAPPGVAGRCRVVRWGPDRITLDADMEMPGYVVLADAYDPGWRTRVDGQPVESLRADFALRAVAVPPGRHRLESTYRPASVGLGVTVSALSAALALAAAWRRGL